MQRVVITGVGCVTPIGNTADALWQALEAGATGIGAHVPADTAIRYRNTAQVREFESLLAATALSSTQLATSERVSQFAILAARQAVAESGITQHHPAEKIAIILGCSTGGRISDEPEVVRVERDNGRVHPLAIPRSMASSGASHVAIDNAITGPAFTISTACASGGHAIGTAFHMVRSGMVSAALAGAHEAPLTKTFLRGWDSMRVVSPTTCRPFAEDRDGMTLGEGAAVLALESLASARSRGAEIYAEVLGFGMSADAHHITQPKPDGPAQAMRACLDDAALTLHATDRPGNAQSLMEEAGYINVHGTGTHTNDQVEAAALAAVFGPRLARIPCSGTKGLHGHSLGASSAIETMITALALKHRRLPFTGGTTVADAALGVDLIVGEPRAGSADGPIVALTNALAFGGLNAVLCLRTC